MSMPPRLRVVALPSSASLPFRQRPVVLMSMPVRPAASPPCSAHVGDLQVQVGARVGDGAGEGRVAVQLPAHAQVGGRQGSQRQRHPRQGRGAFESVADEAGIQGDAAVAAGEKQVAHLVAVRADGRGGGIDQPERLPAIGAVQLVESQLLERPFLGEASRKRHPRRLGR